MAFALFGELENALSYFFEMPRNKYIEHNRMHTAGPAIGYIVYKYMKLSPVHEWILLMKFILKQSAGSIQYNSFFLPSEVALW